MKYEMAIGLEVHAQLLTETKIFCSCSTKFGAEPNSQVCPVCLGMPGVLPVLNKRVVEFGIRTALAIKADIAANMGIKIKSINGRSSSIGLLSEDFSIWY